jgi:hypothetical protein
MEDRHIGRSIPHRSPLENPTFMRSIVIIYEARLQTRPQNSMGEVLIGIGKAGGG